MFVCEFYLYINNVLYIVYVQVVSRHAARGWDKGLCAMSHTPIGGHPQGKALVINFRIGV